METVNLSESEAYLLFKEGEVMVSVEYCAKGILIVMPEIVAEWV